MEFTDMLVLAGLITPIYGALLGIYLKMGKYEAVCTDYMQFKRDVREDLKEKADAN